MKPAEKIEEGGKKALAHSRAAQMVVHGFGEKDIHLVGAILVTKGHYALDMRDIAPMGSPGPGGEKYHRDGRGSDDGVAKKKTKQEGCRKRTLGGGLGSSRCRRSC
jgi:hypothetical protein